MKQRQDKWRNKKKQPKFLTAILIVIATVLASLIVWVGINDWNVEKTLEQAGMESVLSKTPFIALSNQSETPDAPVQPETTPKEPEPTAPVTGPEEVKQKQPKKIQKDDKSFDGGYIDGKKLPKKPTYVKGMLIASKKYPLPEKFAPGENKEAREAFEKMAAEAKLSGFNLTAFSTFRSFDYQVNLYNRYADRDGKSAADRYSARPGYSEHQTGLAFDIGEVNHEKHWASESFGQTEAGKWLLANAHRHGFILRYPKNKEEVTGYMHEAWHYRYVGKSASEEIFKKNITLEEYLGLE